MSKLEELEHENRRLRDEIAILTIQRQNQELQRRIDAQRMSPVVCPYDATNTPMPLMPTVWCR